MKLVLESEQSILLQGDEGAGLAIDAAEPGLAFSAFHMLAGALATCTYSVLWTWGTQARLEVDDLHIRVSWEFTDVPRRVGPIAMELHWPSLPQPRRAAACRAAEQCTVHATLAHGTEIDTRMG